MKLTPAHVRTALLAAQGLTGALPEPATKDDVYAAIRRMHLLQIDTISVVNRSPYLVLYNRVGAFPQKWLNDLLIERQIFEYWAHAACFLPTEDFQYYRPFMLERRAKNNEFAEWMEKQPDKRDLWAAVELVRERIRTEGEVKSADFERTDGQKGGWWNLKAEKRALEYLFYMGELMVVRRDGFQRIYDLQERVKPWDDKHTPHPDMSYRTWTEQTALALGVAPAAWFPDYFRLKKVNAAKALKDLIKDGVLFEVAVEGESTPYYAHKSMKKMLKAITDGAITADRTALYSPFDPVVWDRTRLKAMFGMDYTIEVYTPEPKRKYGYFTLPILHNDRIVGRLDPKAHRGEKRFEVKAIHLEPGVELEDSLVNGLAQAIRDFAEWHGTPEITIGKTDPELLGDALRSTGLL